MQTGQSKKDFNILVKKAHAGDEEAFSELYRLWYTPLFRFIKIRTQISSEDSEDLTQTVFLKFYQECQKKDFTTDAPLSLLYTIARTTIIDNWRKERHAPIANDNLIEYAEETLGEEKDFESQKEDKELITQALNHLPEAQRDMVILKYIQGFSAEEVARIVGKKAAAVRQILSRALKLMRKNLLEH